MAANAAAGVTALKHVSCAERSATYVTLAATAYRCQHQRMFSMARIARRQRSGGWRRRGYNNRQNRITAYCALACVPWQARDGIVVAASVAHKRWRETAGGVWRRRRSETATGMAA
jgi:hypothetical protein